MGVSHHSSSSPSSHLYILIYTYTYIYIALMAQFCLLVSLLTLIIPNLFISVVLSSATFTILNKCQHSIWPGIQSNAGIDQLSVTGFALQKGESKTITAPTSWGGRFWGRTLCTEDSTTGKFTCVTGDCGTGKVDCAGNNAATPATLAEFTLDGSNGLDFYDVSLVDGYNIPMLVVPQGGTRGNCTTMGCAVDLNGACPSELKVTGTEGESVACKSACDAFRQDEYCCKGAYGAPDTCKPSSYSELFKKACPQAYSYAYDDKTSTFTCAGANYLITFCPSPSTSQKASSEGQTPAASNSPVINGTMEYVGVLDTSGGASDWSGASSPSTFTHMSRSHAIAGVVAIVAATWWLCQLI
ncbi:unnamed protein product [Camellia sinensis]